MNIRQWYKPWEGRTALPTSHIMLKSFCFIFFFSGHAILDLALLISSCCFCFVLFLHFKAICFNSEFPSLCDALKIAIDRKNIQSFFFNQKIKIHIHVTPWLIQVNVWQKPLQYCKVISLQQIKINEKNKGKHKLSLLEIFTFLSLQGFFSSFFFCIYFY